MNILSVMLGDLDRRVYPFGFEGENLYTGLRINCIEIFANYPDATVSMVVKPPVGDLYPGTITKTGIVVGWDLTSVDLAYSGVGSAQLTFKEGEVIIKSVIFDFNITSSLSATGNPPTPLEDWLERAEEDLAAFDQDVSDAEAWANGTRNGVPVESSDPAYHNNAKYWADHLAISVSGTTLILNE